MRYLHEVVVWAGDWLSEHLSWLAEDEVEPLQESASETIEFFGGPLDGLEYQVDAASVYRLPPALEIASDQWSELLEEVASVEKVRDVEGLRGDLRGCDELCEGEPKAEPVSAKGVANRIALYDLVLHDSAWQYRYGGQLSRN